MDVFLLCDVPPPPYLFFNQIENPILKTADSSPPTLCRVLPKFLALSFSRQDVFWPAGAHLTLEHRAHQLILGCLSMSTWLTVEAKQNPKELKDWRCVWTVRCPAHLTLEHPAQLFFSCLSMSPEINSKSKDLTESKLCDRVCAQLAAFEFENGAPLVRCL